jgi:hypothetical protein
MPIFGRQNYITHMIHVWIINIDQYLPQKSSKHIPYMEHLGKGSWGRSALDVPETQVQPPAEEQPVTGDVCSNGMFFFCFLGR